MLTDLRSLDLAGKKVLVRCDFNVPLENGAIADPGRIDASLDTIRYILDQGGVGGALFPSGPAQGSRPEVHA